MIHKVMVDLNDEDFIRYQLKKKESRMTHNQIYLMGLNVAEKMTEDEPPFELTCLRCDHQWFPRNGIMGPNPKMCPKCHSPKWDVERIDRDKIKMEKAKTLRETAAKNFEGFGE